MSDDDEYIPIDCGLYSEYELAIMRGDHLRLHWQDEAGTDHMESVQPQDLQTREQGEYLIGRRQNGKTLELRLDHIVRAALVERRRKQ